MSLIETEPPAPGASSRHRWPVLAAAIAMLAMIVSALWLMARNAPTNEVPAATTISPTTPAHGGRPLVEGVYRTPELTREQLIATGVAAGFARLSSG